ncbi:MAG: hypothetical protein E7326_01655 [Clostridiales bacterium]|nr:hypothetical protein [Clostridiales bacterium]
MKHKERSGFLTYHDDAMVAMRCLSDAQLGQLYRALFTASVGEKVADDTLDSIVLPMFLLMRNKIDRDAQKYEEICEKRRSSASSRFHKSADDKSTLQVHANAENCMQEVPTKTVTERETETVPVTERERESVTERETECASCADREDAPATGETASGDAFPSAREDAFTPPTLQEVQQQALVLGSVPSGEQFYHYYAARGWKMGAGRMHDWPSALRYWVTKDLRREKPGAPPRAPRQVSAQMYTQRQYTEQDLDADSMQLFKEAEMLQRTAGAR